MKMDLEEFLELNVDELTAVNGGGSGTCSGSSWAGDCDYYSESTGGSGGSSSGSCSGSSSGVSAGTSGSCGGTGKNTPGAGNTGVPATGSTAGTCSGTTSEATGSTQNKSILDSINEHSNESYIKGVDDCDIWVQNVLQDAGDDISDEWGDAHKTDCDGHEVALAGKTTNTAGNGWSVVIMSDSDNGWESHCGIIDVSGTGGVTFYQNTHDPGHPITEHYSSLTEMEGVYHHYTDFDFYSVSKH